MDKVIVFTQTLDPSVLVSSLAHLQVTLVASRRELAEAFVRESDILCAVLQVDQVDPEFEAFLGSLKRSIPRLNVAVVCDRCAEAVPEVYTRIPGAQEQVTLIQDVQNFVFSAAVTNRRRAHRYDWPLEGYLSLDGDHWVAHRVRALSSYGAFLQSDTNPPQPGLRGKLRIVFQDFRMLTGCEVLDSRHVSSNLPPGFGVRFVDFSPAARSVINRIVNDALVRTLLQPQEEPTTPSLGGETLRPGGELT